jgi:hypothetical protein
VQVDGRVVSCAQESETLWTLQRSGKHRKEGQAELDRVRELAGRTMQAIRLACRLLRGTARKLREAVGRYLGPNLYSNKIYSPSVSLRYLSQLLGT